VLREECEKEKTAKIQQLKAASEISRCVQVLSPDDPFCPDMDAHCVFKYNGEQRRFALAKDGQLVLYHKDMPYPLELIPCYNQKIKDKAIIIGFALKKRELSDQLIPILDYFTINRTFISQDKVNPHISHNRYLSLADKLDIRTEDGFLNAIYIVEYQDQYIVVSNNQALPVFVVSGTPAIKFLDKHYKLYKNEEKTKTFGMNIIKKRYYWKDYSPKEGELGESTFTFALPTVAEESTLPTAVAEELKVKPAPQAPRPPSSLIKEQPKNDQKREGFIYRWMWKLSSPLIWCWNLLKSFLWSSRQ
jgi:hypothetical protein